MSQNMHQFVFGQSQKFVATRTFDLGNTNMKVIEGMTVEFDGTTINVNGFRHQMPQLRGAIRMGWLTPEAEYDPDAPAQRPQPAGVQVRHATKGGNPFDRSQGQRQVLQTETEENEQEVARVADHAAETKARNTSNYRRDASVQNRVHGKGGVKGGTRQDSGAVEQQDGTVVRSLKTKARQDTVLTPETVGSAIRESEKIKVDAQPTTKTRESLLQNLTEEERAEYGAEINARRGAYTTGPEEPKIVGRVESKRSHETEGFTVNNSVGGGVGIADMGGTGGAGKDQMQVIEEEGIRFGQTNGPKKMVRVEENPQKQVSQETMDTRRKIARAICPDFPENYVFSDPVRKKIARLQADYDDRPDVIRAVAAAETDDAVKQRLVEEFPQAFA
jgi:hypothetical protein